MAGVCHEVNVRDGHRICTRAEHNRRVFRTNNAAVGTIKMESLALEHVLRKQSQDLNTDKPNGLPLTAALTTTTLTLLARPRHGIHPRPLTFESTVYYRLTIESTLSRSEYYGICFLLRQFRHVFTFETEV